MSDQFSLSSLNVIWTFFLLSIYFGFGVQQKMCMELPLGLSLLAGPRELTAGSFQPGKARSSSHAVAAGLIPRSQSCIASIKIEIQQPSSSKYFRT